MCLSRLSSQVGSRCHEEVVRIRTQGGETNDHLVKSYKVALIQKKCFCRRYFSERVLCDTALLLVHLGMENVDETLVAS